MPSAQPLARLAPPLFVVIWATGFIVARIVAPYAEPLTFLLVRYLLAIAVLAGLVLAAGLSWPGRGGNGAAPSWPAFSCTGSIWAACSGP